MPVISPYIDPSTLRDGYKDSLPQTLFTKLSDVGTDMAIYTFLGKYLVIEVASLMSLNEIEEEISIK